MSEVPPQIHLRSHLPRLGLCSAQEFRVTHEAVHQTPPFPQVPHSHFPLFLLPFETKGNKDIVTSLGLLRTTTRPGGSPVLTRNHFAATATPDYSTGEEQCGTFGTGRSSQGGNCALQISVISENDSK